ncbi:GDSL-like lipase/acylhydrolase [Aureococcus anophagefferens]|uniref:GDSL-like lipase/acylhydrolase n=1 Tax=Aureococcus anophagefferens TaxID=44056 RepID=A0ABR1G6T9_AURAN
MDTRSSALAAAAGAALGGLAVYVLSRRRDDGPPPAPAPRQTFRHFPVRGPLQRSYSLAATSLGEDATVRVVCYGDSNTWGFDAFSPAAAREGVLCRFCEGGRWPRVAEKLLGPGYAVVEEGLNGRTTVHPDPLMGDYDANGRATLAAILHSHKPFDVVVLMLGTNDLKTHLSLTPEQIAKGASTLVGDVFKMGVTRSAERPKVLLVAPPKVWDKPEWGFAGARSRSDACRACYAAEAEAHGCAFLDANDVFAIPDPAKEGGDGIHLSPANAKALGAAVAAKIESMMA